MELSDGTILPLPWKHRGPREGEGRGHGRAWRGVVEETTAYWVGWFVTLAKACGKTPPELGIAVGGVDLWFRSTRLTYGERWYLECPHCSRNCEALYLLGGVLACRQCHHLGYRSQCMRSSSPAWPWARLLGRASWLPRRMQAGPAAKVFEAMLRRTIDKNLAAILAGIEFK